MTGGEMKKENGNTYATYNGWAAFIPYELMGAYRAADVATQWVDPNTGEITELSANDLQVYAHIFKQSLNHYQQQSITEERKGWDKEIRTTPGDCFCGDSCETIGKYLGTTRKRVERSIGRLVKAGLIIKDNIQSTKEDGKHVTIPRSRPASYEEWLKMPVERHVLYKQRGNKTTPKDKPQFSSKSAFIESLQ